MVVKPKPRPRHNPKNLQHSLHSRADQAALFHFRDAPPPNKVCLFSSISRSHHPSRACIIVLRLDLTLSRSGLRGPSEKAGEGGGSSSGGTGGRGGISSTGLAISLMRTLFSRIDAVGGGGNHGWRALSESESLSNRFSRCAMAVVPRLRLRLRAAMGPGPAVGPAAIPRPHLQ